MSAYQHRASVLTYDCPRFKHLLRRAWLARGAAAVVLTLPAWPSRCRPSGGCTGTTSAPASRADRCWWSGTPTGRWGWVGPVGSTAAGPLGGGGPEQVISECWFERCVRGGLPCTRKQKSFHMSRRVSLVKPSASYSTIPLEHTHKEKTAKSGHPHGCRN